MFKFSTGLFTGTMLGIGVMLMDKKTVKKARKMIHRANICSDWF